MKPMKSWDAEPVVDPLMLVKLKSISNPVTTLPYCQL